MTTKTPVGGQLTLTGMVKQGVEPGCLLLTDDKTTVLFNLTGGNPKIVKIGATVTVTGTIPGNMASYCQQGKIFQVLTATSN